MSFHTKCFLSIVFSLFFSIITLAQGTTGTIQGTVKDATGTPIAGATVWVKNETEAVGFQKTAITDEKGRFLIAEIPSGNYRITAEFTGFHKWASSIEIFVDKTALVEIFMDVGSVTTTTIVIEDLDDSTDATPEIRTNNKRTFLETLPRRTTFGSLLKIVPNTRPEPLVSGFQIDGNSGADNTFFIDGQEVTNYKTGLLNSNNNLPFEFLQEVQVRSSGFSAEYAGATGGVINVVTNGGNNALHGSFGISFVPSKWQGNPNAVLTRFGSGAGQIEYFQPTRNKGTDWFPSAVLSGPLAKNKLWFFASYAPQIAETFRQIDYYTSSNPAVRSVSETVEYRTKVQTEQVFVRLDAQPFKNLRTFGTFLYNPTVQDGALPSVTEGLGGVPQAAGGLRGAAFLATRGGRQNSNMVNGQLSWSITENFALNLRAGRSFLNEKLDSYGVPRITRYICSVGASIGNCATGFQNVANNFVRDFDVSKRTTFDVEAGLYGLNFFGRHYFKFGYGFNRVLSEIREGYTDTGIIQLFYGRSIDVLGVPVTPTPGNLGSGFLQRFGTVGNDKGTNQSFYVQNVWTIKERLFLNLGIRFENEEIPDYGKNRAAFQRGIRYFRRRSHQSFRSLRMVLRPSEI